uniref:Uncharacterized protein n=1 Tax=Oryzias latipes TaxID=8090 RepID=A0A3P9LIJ9_ORYLA
MIITDQKLIPDLGATDRKRILRMFYQAKLFLSGTLDQMGRRIKDLEKNVAELMSQAGMEASSDQLASQSS